MSSSFWDNGDCSTISSKGLSYNICILFALQPNWNPRLVPHVAQVTNRYIPGID
jgi:hypothetical protein